MMTNSQIVFPEGSYETLNKKFFYRLHFSVFSLELGYSLLPIRILVLTQGLRIVVIGRENILFCVILVEQGESESLRRVPRPGLANEQGSALLPPMLTAYIANQPSLLC